MAGQGPSSQTDADASALEVVIAGAGVAALEAALALHDLAGDRINLTLLAPTDEFVYRPVAVLEPFEETTPRRLALSTFAAEVNAVLEQGSLVSVDSERHMVGTESGKQLRYDALLVAVGARSAGVVPGAIAMDVTRLGDSLHELIRDIRAGRVKSVAFVAPVPTWPLPIYEVALLADEEARRQGVVVDITIITAEPSPLAIFGEDVSAAVARLLADTGIRVTAGARLDSPHATLAAHPGEEEPRYDRVIAIPRLQGPAISGLPRDADGFLPITPNCEVVGESDVFAAGDCSDVQVKFGAVAAQQADAAATSIAALAGAPTEPRPFEGIVHGCLLSGRTAQPLYFSAELGEGGARSSQVTETSSLPPDAKIAARYLGPYLDRLWAAAPRWVAGQLSWEAVLARLEREHAPTQPHAS